MRLLQYVDNQLTRVARANDDGTVTPLARFETMYALARRAIERRCTLAQVVSGEKFDAPLAYQDLKRDGRILPPLTHPDPAHCLVSGTGLTHLGSATTRDAMHVTAKSQVQDAPGMTDSMRMFRWGLEGGRPPEGRAVAQPEWFYKGNGNVLVG